MSNSKLCIKWGITEASRLPEGGVILTSGYFQQPKAFNSRFCIQWDVIETLSSFEGKFIPEANKKVVLYGWVKTFYDSPPI